MRLPAASVGEDSLPVVFVNNASLANNDVTRIAQLRPVQLVPMMEMKKALEEIVKR